MDRRKKERLPTARESLRDTLFTAKRRVSGLIELTEVLTEPECAALVASLGSALTDAIDRAVLGMHEDARERRSLPEPPVAPRVVASTVGSSLSGGANVTVLR